MPRSLAEIPLGNAARIVSVEGPRAFRRRLLEMGLTPGTTVKVINVAPFGDPIEIEVRQSRLSIRRFEAEKVDVRT